MSKNTVKVMVDYSAVVKANSKRTNVVRTSIPGSVRNVLDIKAGDTLAWEISHDGTRVFVKVTKGEKAKPESDRKEN